MMIVMNFLRGQTAPALKRMVQQACTGEQECLRTFALDYGLYDLLAAIKPDAARIRPKAKLPGWRRASNRARALSLMDVAFKPVPHMGSNL
jgi:hypothetical protein